MTGEDLYNEFKAALEYLGSGFRGMAEVQVHLDGTKLCMCVEGRECAIALPFINEGAGLK